MRLLLPFCLMSFVFAAPGSAQQPAPGAASAASGRTVVFEQPGFPTIASEPVDHATLVAALTDGANEPVFADEKALESDATLAGASLLVLPYGSAVPANGWKAMQHFLHAGGDLLILGGQPLHVPVSWRDGTYTPERPQDSYALALGFRHTYEIPVAGDAKFAWKDGYGEGSAPAVHATHYFAVEGRLDGLGYMVSPEGELTAAPVIFANRLYGQGFGGRTVALDFTPEPGFWASPDGTALIRRAAAYARQGAGVFSVETLFSTLRPGETPTLSVHLRTLRPGSTASGQVKVELLGQGRTLDQVTLPVTPASGDELPVAFVRPLPPGFYQVAATWTEGGHVREFYRNGFWVAPLDALDHGPVLAASTETLTRDGKPFLPVGTNYFSTEENGWDFSGPRNAGNWERDFADMQRHGVSFVRTGVWMPNAKFVEGDLGGVTQRFLRNLEGFLLSAQRHGISVNFTFFAFSPKSGSQRPDEPGGPPPANPYLDPGTVRAEQAYVRSVVARFSHVPFLSWDLINEPSFSNPRVIFKGNYPNNDPAEGNAWHAWLRERYQDLAVLANAWSVTPEELNSFDAIGLPAPADLNYDRYGNPRNVRAVDYNLFAQDMFRGWVKGMLETIRGAGSTQLVDVGQDEGGVTDRVLNQFYAGAGVSFTTNHTYWQDDALLWDSFAAKVVGVPNITGETGYQPAWAPDGAWRYDELTGQALTERKWALGFAAGSTGAMQWDWAREVDFGMQRSDGSARQWEGMMRDLGAFAEAAAPYAHGMIAPEIAIVLPQTLQLSVYNSYALEAQQTAVRVLYQQARGAAYAVGEYQAAGQLGQAKLILLPSPLGLSESAWTAIEARVRAGATLLVTGPFDGDAHLHATGLARDAGLEYTTVPLDLREQHLVWPGGDDVFPFPGKATTVLEQARLSDGSPWKEVTLGQGKILFAAFPLELSSNLAALGRVYAYAMKQSGVATGYTTSVEDPGLLICPTEYADATLYVLTSETETRLLTFTDRRSGKTFSGTLEPGRAALLMIGTDGRLLSQYRWHAAE